jgi:shikimate dehydrogenase
VYYRCGLVGERISNSFSPRIFEWGLRLCGLEGEYLLYDLPPDRAQQLVEGSSWHGLNITTPYKTSARAWCRGLTDGAKAVDAVNVLFRNDGAVWGDNTDVGGCEFALRRRWGGREVDCVLVIGSGGAARAIAQALKQVFVPREIGIASRDPQLARARFNSAAEDLPKLRFLSLQDAASKLHSFDAVIQATPVGGTGHEGTPLPEPLHFRSGALVMDLVYAPRVTSFLRAAAREGAQTENGLVMLMAQAAASFEIWTGCAFPLERALTELLPELGVE